MSLDKTNSFAVPVGAPEWVTPELLADTLATWHAMYSEPLTAIDALEILLGVSRLCDFAQTFNFLKTET